MDRKYIEFIRELKQNIIQSRFIAARLANKEQLLLYYNTGRMLSEKIASEKWGAKVVQQISEDLQKTMHGLKGFSYRNLKNMQQFYESYEDLSILQSMTAELQRNENQSFKSKSLPRAQSDLGLTNEFDSFFNLSFTHHILLVNKCTDKVERVFYMAEAARQYWSVSILEHQIESRLYERQGKLPNNFKGALPGSLELTALQIFKDEYLMDFMGLNEQCDEKELESGIVSNIKDLILRMGKGFLQCLVAFELKKGRFKPEYAGQLNFYLNVLDEKIRLSHENSSIGIVLCKEKNNTIVEFSIKNIEKGMGVATYKTTNKLPKAMKGLFPNTEDLVKLL
jgi:predicted nuclease of restriction endonuclease-like (RecB) superfamily